MLPERSVGIRCFGYGLPMEATPARPTTLRGLSSFLLEHEPHGAGFDVAHPAGVGSGRVGITCRGCGADHEYVTATIELERELSVEPAHPPGEVIKASARDRAEGLPSPPRADASRTDPSPMPRTRAPAPPEPTRRHKPPSPDPPSSDSRIGDGEGRRWPLPLALVAVALLALVFAASRLLGGAGDGGSGRSTAGAPAAKPEPAPTAGPEDAAPAPSAPAPAPEPTATPVSTKTYTIEAEPGWHRRHSQQGLLLEPRGSEAVSLQVFAGAADGLPLQDLAASTTALLHRAAGVLPGPPHPIVLHGKRAFRIKAVTSSRKLAAIGIIDGGTRYLLVTDVHAEIPGQLRSDLNRMLGSFRPR